MKSAPRPESTTAKPKQKRRNRPRPTPKWMKAQAEGPEAVAQRRCLLVLAVLSGEQPVTDAIESTGVSRQLYYQLEEKALKGMVHALGPGSEANEELAQSLATQLELAQERVKQLETEKRRAERLLLLTRKLVRPGPMVGRGRPRKYKPRSTKAGPASSTSGPTKTATAEGTASTPTSTSEAMP
jgi:uncharacterized protein YggU (UPF0235/DUF167 family)